LPPSSGGGRFARNKQSSRSSVKLHSRVVWNNLENAAEKCVEHGIHPQVLGDCKRRLSECFGFATREVRVCSGSFRSGQMLGDLGGSYLFRGDVLRGSDQLMDYAA